MDRVKYGYRKLKPAECAAVARARRRLRSVGRTLDGLPIEPVKERTISADLDAVDYRLYLVQHQLCRRKK